MSSRRTIGPLPTPLSSATGMFLPPPSLRRPYDQDGNFPVWLFGADHWHRSAGDHLARLTSAQPRRLTENSLGYSDSTSKLAIDTLAQAFHKAFTGERLVLFQLLEKHLLARSPHRGLFFACDLSRVKKGKPRLIKMNSVACPNKPLLNADRDRPDRHGHRPDRGHHHHHHHHPAA